MDVTLLYFDGCPNWKTTHYILERLAPQFGFEVVKEKVAGPDDAQRLGFHGSPTVLIDGVDPFADKGAPITYSCRVYQTPQGLRGSPTREMLEVALERR